MEDTFLDPVLPFEAWKSRQPKTSKSIGRSRKLKPADRNPQTTEAKWTHNPLGETLSTHDFYSMRPEAMNQEIKSVCDTLLEQLDDVPSMFEDFRMLSDALEKYKKGPEHVWIDICVIGGTGIGKSTFINAILNRSGLADASDSTKACTQHATTYEYLPGAPDDTKFSDVKVVILDASTREKDAIEHISYYAKVHFPVPEEMPIKNDPDESEAQDVQVSNDQETEAPLPRTVLTEEDRTLAKSALEYFRVIWGTENDQSAEEDLCSLLNYSGVHGGELLIRCLQEQEERLQELCLHGKMYDEHTVIFEHVPDVMGVGQDTDILDLPAVRALAANVWPLVSKVYVATGGPLLRNGVALTDLPGYGDLNQNRIAIANSFRRHADFELIVAEGLRLEDSKPVHRQLRSAIHAHGVERTMLIVNKIDAHFKTDDAEVQEFLDKSDQAPFPELNGKFNKLNDLDNMDGIDTKDIDAYEYLFSYATSAVKRLKANELKSKMRAVYGDGLAVHTVSSQIWLDWLNPSRRSDPQFGANMSGIPKIQKAFLDLTADANLARYRLHYFGELPKIRQRSDRILNKSVREKSYSSFCTAAKKNIQAFKTLNRLATMSIVNASVLEVLSEAERTCATQQVRSLLELFKTRWSVRWNTWNLTLKTNGIPHGSVSTAYADKDVNWNRDLLDILEQPTVVTHEFSASKKHIQIWKDRMIKKSKDLLKPLSEPIVAISRTIKLNLEQADMSLNLKNRAWDAWHQPEFEIKELLQNLEDDLRATITQVYRDVTTEEDVGCTIAKLTKNPFAQAQSEQLGLGAWNRQQQRLRANLANFVEKYEEEAIRKMKCELRKTADNLTNNVERSLDTFIESTEQFFASAHYNTPRHASARSQLMGWLPKYLKVVKEVQSKFPQQESLERNPKRIKVEPGTDG